MSKNINILIIAYKFPPMGGIGTRRWAKFAKYLARKGYKVHILTIDYPKIDKVNWYHDIKDNDNIIIHKVKSGYPLWLMNLSSNRFISFIQKMINFLLKKTFFYIDIAQNWAKYMLPEAKKIILENNIINVIATNPPPSVSYISTYLKIELPYINLIQDFRDSWNDDIDYDYPKTLKFFWQKEKSVYMEWFVINHSDKIVNVTQDITKRIKKKFGIYKDKFVTIYNGFDRDDINNIKPYNKPIKNNNKIKIIYAGGLGLGRIEAIKLIMDVLLMLDEKTLNRIELNIYTSYDKSKLDKKYYFLFEKKVVNFYEMVSPKEIYNIINEHDYCLSINSPIYPYAFGTKIFDYMMLNKKIIHISGDGELSRLLIKKGQFVANYNKEEIKNIIKKILNENTYSVINYDEFDIANLVKNFERLFIYEKN
jgi:glycosyltransferase involved in cell wall biosynthesis